MMTTREEGNIRLHGWCTIEYSCW